MRNFTVAARRGRRWLLAFRAASMLLILFATEGLHPQETDLIDTRDLAGRAVSFETDGLQYHGVQHLSAVGDVNGDGIADIGLIRVVSTPVFELTVHLILGSPEWAGRNSIGPELPGSARFLLSDLEATGVWHTYIINTGDVNGDGYADFTFAFTGYQPLGSDGSIRGVVFIVHGKPVFDHPEAFVEDIGGTIPGMIIYNTHPDRLATGHSGGCVVDINGDVRQDLAFGGIVDSANSRPGVVYVLLDVGNLPPRVDLLDIGGVLPGFRLHMAGSPTVIAPAGDIDGDGFQDLLVTDGLDAPARGSVYIFYGRADPSGAYNLRVLSEEGDGVLRLAIPNRLEDEDQLLYALEDQAAGAGDVNGDGFADLLIGESYTGSIFIDGLADSKAHLVLGGPRLPSPLPLDEVPAARRKVFHGLEVSWSRDRFGGTVGSPGDLNGDGVPDFLIGAPHRGERLDSAGEAYLLHGRRDMPDHTYLDQGFDGIRISGDRTYGGLGKFLGPAGDFNADGSPDFLVAERHHSGRGTGTSRAFVVFGTGNGEPPLTVSSFEPRSGFLRGGTRVRIHGSGFKDGALVRFGASPARLLAPVLPSELVAESPAGAVLGDAALTVTVEGVTRTAREPFEYIPDRPELDLENPGRWGLRLDDAPGSQIGLGLDFADFDGDGLDDLLIGSDLFRDWMVTVLRGGRSLPAATGALTRGPGKCLIFERNETERVSTGVHVRNLGDINGDGFTDVGVAAVESSYLLFGRPDLPEELDFEAEVEAGRAVHLILAAGNSPQAGFVPLGDMTGDGAADFVIALSGEGVLFLEGRREWPRELDPRERGSFVARLSGDGGPIAGHVAAAGDANGDGHPDLLVSGSSAGNAAVYLVHLVPPLATLPEEAPLEEFVLQGGGVIFAWESGTASSMHVSGAGDVNGDGIDDFLIGDERGTVAESYQGVTYLIHGRTDLPERVVLPRDLGPVAFEGVVRLGSAAVKQSGRALSPIGDYNGDGRPDFTIASADHTILTPWQIDVVFGGPDLPPLLELGNLGRHGFRIDGVRPYTALDRVTQAAGDLNDDGAPDFAFSETPGWYLEDGSLAPGAVHVVFGLPPGVPFIRGDADDDGRLNITDGVFTLTFLFLGGVDPPCEDASDTDDRGTIELTDAVYLLNHLFLGGPAPPAPYPGAGVDPTEDRLGCLGY